ncbi:MAG TPA: hypothetical protein VN203_04500, partial [Candidatus Acidoferrum sp.]|nr:hypothetical protein [Candidatus Acidoferrum sp.]
MRRGRLQVRHWVCFLAVLLAGSFPSVIVLDVAEESPEDSFVDQPEAEAARRIGAAGLLRAKKPTRSSPAVAHGSIVPRIPTSIAAPHARPAVVTPARRSRQSGLLPR